MNAQEKLAAIEQHAAKALIECRRIHGDNVNWAIEQHAAKALIEIRELMVELAVSDPQNAPPAVASFAMRARLRAEAKNKPPPQCFPGMRARAIAAREAGTVWPDDAA